MSSGPRRKGRQLSPEEKWQVFFGGVLAAAFAGRRGPQVGRGCLDGDQAAPAGQGRGAGGVRGLQAGAAGVDRAARARGAARGERPALGGDQGAGGGALVAPGKAALGLFGPVPARVSAQTKLEQLGLIDAATRGRLVARARVRGARARRCARASPRYTAGAVESAE